jgi:hypothetical protein
VFVDEPSLPQNVGRSIFYLHGENTHTHSYTGSPWQPSQAANLPGLFTGPISLYLPLSRSQSLSLFLSLNTKTMSSFNSLLYFSLPLESTTVPTLSVPRHTFAHIQSVTHCPYVGSASSAQYYSSTQTCPYVESASSAQYYSSTQTCP